MKKNQKGFSAIEAVLVIVVIGLVGAVGWLVFDKQKTPQPQQASKELAPKSTLSEGFTEYKNTSLGFSFGYPKAWGSVTGEEKANQGAQGSYFYGTFSANDTVKLIYNSADYNAFPGGGCELSRRVIVKQIDPGSPTEDSKIIKSDSAVDIEYKEGAHYYTANYDGTCLVESYYDAATFNTKSTIFPAAQLRQEYAAERDAKTQKQFNDVIKTVKLL